MITIEFDFHQKITIIQANLSDPFRVPFNQFFQRASIPPNSVNFIANGLTILPEDTVESHMSDISKQDQKMTVLVEPVYISNKNEFRIQSNDIICPECKEPYRIKIDDYRVKLYYLLNLISI